MKQVYKHDEDAVKKLAEGSEEAFHFLFEKYFFGVGRIGLKYLQDTKLSQDLVQDIFSAVWANRSRFKDVENFRAYLFIMTKNLALEYLKKLGREALAREEFSRLREVGDNNVEHYLREKECGQLIEQAVEKLRPQQKQIFELGKNQGLSHTAIAEQLELSPQTVSNQMSLALKTIKGYMKSHIVSLLLLQAIGGF